MGRNPAPLWLTFLRIHRFVVSMTLPTKALLGAAFLCAASLAHAELTFEKTELELTPAAGADSAVFNFKYEIKGISRFTSTPFALPVAAPLRH